MGVNMRSVARGKRRSNPHRRRQLSFGYLRQPCMSERERTHALERTHTHAHSGISIVGFFSFYLFWSFVIEAGFEIVGVSGMEDRWCFGMGTEMRGNGDAVFLVVD